MRHFDLSIYTEEELYWAIYQKEQKEQKEQTDKGFAPKGR